MNENVLDVLVYLFENSAMHDSEATRVVRSELGEAGFSSDEIETAFEWLRATRAATTASIDAPSGTSTRIYADAETQILDTACQNTLVHLENCGVLCPVSRELVIDRMLALADQADEPAETEHLHWVVMLVLAADGQLAACERLESIIDLDAPDRRH